MNTTEAVEEAKAEIDKLGLLNLPDLEDEDEVDDDWMGTKTFLAHQMANNDKAHLRFIRGAVEAREPAQEAEIEAHISEIKTRFGQTSLSGMCPVDPPIRGPFGEAEIWLKPDAIPVNVAPYRIPGERKAAWVKLVDEARDTGKL